MAKRWSLYLRGTGSISTASGHGRSTLPLGIAAGFEGRPVAALVGNGGWNGPTPANRGFWRLLDAANGFWVARLPADVGAADEPASTILPGILRLLGALAVSYAAVLKIYLQRQSARIPDVSINAACHHQAS